MSDINNPARPRCVLEPMDLHDPVQADELLRQRVICGWNATPEYIAGWRADMDAKTKNLFWINLITCKPASQPDLRIGHISLNSSANPPDEELANPHDKSVLTITTFFILPEHRRGGIGRAAMETIEKQATVEPYGSRNCKATTVTTLCQKYYDDDEWRAEYERVSGNKAPERGTCSQAWYERMGYVKWKEEPMYENSREGFEDYKYIASFLKKKIA